MPLSYNPAARAMVEYGSKYVYRYDSLSGSDVAIFPSRKLDRGLRVRYEVFINKAAISAEMLWDVVRGFSFRKYQRGKGCGQNQSRGKFLLGG